MHTVLDPFALNQSRTRPIVKLNQNHSCHTLINGDNLASIVLAFFLLESTNKSVSIICPGILGENSNQLSQNILHSHQSFSQLIDKFGVDKAKFIHKFSQNSLKIIKNIFTSTKIVTQSRLVTSYQVYYQDSDLQNAIQDVYYLDQLKFPHKKILISNESIFKSRLSPQYFHLCQFLPQHTLQTKIQNHQPKLLGIYPQKNIYLYTSDFIEKLATYCLKKYPQRFNIFEYTLVEKLHLKSNSCQIDTSNQQINCEKYINALPRKTKWQRFSGYLPKHGKKTPFLNFYYKNNHSFYLAQQPLSRQNLVYLSTPNPVNRLKQNLTSYCHFPQPLNYSWKSPVFTTKTGLPLICPHPKQKNYYYLQFPSQSCLGEQLSGAFSITKLIKNPNFPKPEPVCYNTKL